MIGPDPLDLGFTEFRGIFGENAGANRVYPGGPPTALSSSTSQLFPKGAS
jgi:hypothetical protein